MNQEQKGRGPKAKNENREAEATSKSEQLEAYRENSQNEYLTTDQGVKISHTDDTLKAGIRGPTLIEDFHFREKITRFDHERIPERVVHARGSGAHGLFQVYEPMTEYTMASFLQDPSKQTPVFVRFSTVVGSRGSADTVRDVRGFATKFYTEEGNYDLVGNNMPIFFIQDAIKFPDLVHAIKPEQDDEMPQASAAHDTFWDFVGNTPETMHMIMWVLSDRALPRSYRMMDGFGVNTFRFINAKGKGRFVKFHWRAVLGAHSLVWDETQKVAGKDPDYNRRDLWEAIEMGDYPEYEFGVQMIEAEDEFKFDFDILDATKIWPEEDVPLRMIGKMTLNRNPDNFFAETEQVAFCPANVVPGIDFSNDPLLQGRLFSYLDTQITRLGGPNFHEIPINRPIVPVHNNQRDGFHRHMISIGKTAYSPNALNAGFPHPAPENEGSYVHYSQRVDGEVTRSRSDSFKDFFSQAALFWRSQSKAEKEHEIEAFHFELGKVKVVEVRERVVQLLGNIDGELARMVAERIAVPPPYAAAKAGDGRVSPALSMENTRKDSIKSRRIAALVADGFDADGLRAVKKALTDAGAHVKLISKNLNAIKSADGNPAIPDMSFTTSASVVFDAVLIPGGRESVDSLRMSGDALHFISEAYKHCKPVGAMKEGAELLAAAGVHRGEPVEAIGDVRSDKGVVTMTGDDDQAFAQALIKAIMMHRHWDRADKEQVPA